MQFALSFSSVFFPLAARRLRHGASKSGLRLAIARRIVELHGGQLTVASPAGQGTCFAFSVPVYRVGEG